MGIKDIAEEKAELVLDAYRYALDNNLDIHNKDDVTKILKELDSKRSSKEDVESFMPMLEIFDKMTKAELEKRRKIN